MDGEGGSLGGEYGINSDAVAMFGTGGQWRGNIGFADGHIEFSGQPDPEGVTFQEIEETDGNRISRRDNIFVDERMEAYGNLDVGARSNSYLRQAWKGVPLSGGDLTDAAIAQVENGEYLWIDGDDTD